MTRCSEYVSTSALDVPAAAGRGLDGGDRLVVVGRASTLTQTSAEFTLTTWSDATARPTWAATSSTPGTARSSSTRLRRDLVHALAATYRAAVASDTTHVALLERRTQSRCRGRAARRARRPRPHRRRRTRAAAWARSASRAARIASDPAGRPATREALCPLPSSIMPSAGVTVTATTIEAATASRYVDAIGGRNAPASPSMKNAGSSTAATTISVANSDRAPHLERRVDDDLPGGGAVRPCSALSDPLARRCRRR